MAVAIVAVVISIKVVVVVIVVVVVVVVVVAIVAIVAVAIIIVVVLVLAVVISTIDNSSYMKSSNWTSSGSVLPHQGLQLLHASVDVEDGSAFSRIFVDSWTREVDVRRLLDSLTRRLLDS